MKVSKNQYLQGFGVIVIVLALLRCACPRIAMSKAEIAAEDSLNTVCDTTAVDSVAAKDSLVSLQNAGVSEKKNSSAPIASEPRAKEWQGMPHRIFSVPGRFQDNFPDSQQVHLQAAQQWGVKSVANRADAENRKAELVYVGASPFYCLDNMRSSIPYLVPRASDLLNDMGRAYFDSLYVKGIPLHKFIVTSVLRTKEDVEKLCQRNGNATENSCHLYGTTFDIAQNRYKTVYDPRKGKRREVQNDTLKWVLSEVLRDFRKDNRCYIKYEVKQGCFHVTVR